MDEGLNLTKILKTIECLDDMSIIYLFNEFINNNLNSIVKLDEDVFKLSQKLVEGVILDEY